MQTKGQHLMCIAVFGRYPANVLLVRPDFPARSVQEFVAVAKANAGKFSFGSQGIGTASHLTGELFRERAKANISFVHAIGASVSLNDVIAGHINLMSVSVSLALPPHQAGQLKILGIGSEKPQWWQLRRPRKRCSTSHAVHCGQSKIGRAHV